jgi:hypothetical protein
MCCYREVGLLAMRPVQTSSSPAPHIKTVCISVTACRKSSPFARMDTRMKFEKTTQYRSGEGIVFNLSQMTLMESDRGRLRELHFGEAKCAHYQVNLS